MGFDMDKELFIIKKVASTLGTGNKIKWMEKAHCIIQTTKLPMMETGKMINFTVMELSTMNKLLFWKNPLIIKTGQWLNNIGSNMKVNSVWITNMEEANFIFQTDKYLRAGLKKIWSMGKEYSAEKMEVVWEEYGEKINYSECIEIVIV